MTARSPLLEESGLPARGHVSQGGGEFLDADPDGHGWFRTSDLSRVKRVIRRGWFQGIPPIHCDPARTPVVDHVDR